MVWAQRENARRPDRRRAGGRAARARRIGLIGLAGLAMVSLAVGCQPASRCPGSVRRWGEPVTGTERASILFNPAPAAIAAAPPAGPPMELFNWRPDWPVVTAAWLPEITFYRERYCDWQSSSTAGWGYIHNYFRRSFEVYRVGAWVR